jgi:hypothetical protein
MKYLIFVLQFIVEFLFGVRVEGEPVPEPSFKTLLPEQQLEEFEWINEFRVGIEYGKQRLFFGQS